MEDFSNNNVVLYSLKCLLRSFLGFFYDWYFVFPRIFWKKVFRFFKDLDRSLALKSMVRHWFSPLYQDYTLPGYFIGVFIRTGWIISDVFFYTIFFALALLFFLVWLLFLPYLGWLILVNLFYG